MNIFYPQCFDSERYFFSPATPYQGAAEMIRVAKGQSVASNTMEDLIFLAYLVAMVGYIGYHVSIVDLDHPNYNAMQGSADAEKKMREYVLSNW